MDFVVPADHGVELEESEKRDKYQDLAREIIIKKTVEHESDGDTNCNWCTWNNRETISMVTGKIGNKGNTGKSPGDLIKLAVTQT